jgi:hypothetical protein
LTKRGPPSAALISVLAARTGKPANALFIQAQFGGGSFINHAAVIEHVGAVGNLDAGACAFSADRAGKSSSSLR